MIKINQNKQTQFYMWILFLVTLIFFPPLPIGFAGANSSVSGAIFVVFAYILWIIIKKKDVDFGNGIPGILNLLFVFYLILHICYYTFIQKNMMVFLWETQWLIYFWFGISIINGSIKIVGKSKMVRLFILIMFVEACLAILTSFIGPIYEYRVGWYEGRYGISLYRALGTFGSANGLAGFLAFFSLIAMFCKKDWLPMNRYLILLIYLIALLLTQSKSGIMAFIIALGVTTIVRFFGTRTIRSYMFFCIVVCTIAISFLVFDNFMDLIKDDYGGRSHFTKHVIQQYLDNDIFIQLIGMGFRQTAFLNYETMGWVTAHNSYVSFLAEIGALGVLILGMIYIITLIKAVLTKNWPIVGGIVVITVHFYTETFIYGIHYSILLCFIMGMVFGRDKEYKIKGS